LDFSSGLAFIRENWGVNALAARDAAANSFMPAFDFASPPRPPVLLPSVRHVAEPKKANIAVLYPSYGIALGVPMLFIGYARRRRRTARHSNPDAAT
jgi:phospholipase C